MASWRCDDATTRHGSEPPARLAPSRPRHSCDLGRQKVINEVGYRTSNWRFPKRENRSVVLLGIAEQIFFPFSPEKEDTARGARGGFLPMWCVTVTSQKLTQPFTHSNTQHAHQKKERPSFTDHGNHVRSTKIAVVARGANARPGRAPKNEHPPTTTRLIFGAPPRGHRESFLQARVRDDDTSAGCRKAVTNRRWHRGVAMAPRPTTVRNRQPASHPPGRHSFDLGP